MTKSIEIGVKQMQLRPPIDMVLGQYYIFIRGGSGIFFKGGGGGSYC